MAGPEKHEITPEPLYLNRRAFLRGSIFAGTLLATGGAYRFFTPGAPPEPAAHDLSPAPAPPPAPAAPGDALTPLAAIASYNNFYEFSTSKDAVAEKARHWVPGPWRLEVGGLVHKPTTFSTADLARFGSQERIYRFRCVEGWSMVIPWQGFSLAKLLESVEPKSGATHVAFTSYFNQEEMPNARYAGIPFPYVEGLRLDEALHPLTFFATGLYGRPLPNQNGAPMRLVVPWKYGFKSIKSVVKITLTAAEPPTTWNAAAPNEYGFYSNVNPAVSHPRWSQAQERRIGESGLRPTLPFNGYEEVASLYTGMDLTRYF